MIMVITVCMTGLISFFHVVLTKLTRSFVFILET